MGRIVPLEKEIDSKHLAKEILFKVIEYDNISIAVTL